MHTRPIPLFANARRLATRGKGFQTVEIDGSSKLLCRPRLVAPDLGDDLYDQLRDRAPWAQPGPADGSPPGGCVWMAPGAAGGGGAAQSPAAMMDVVAALVGIASAALFPDGSTPFGAAVLYSLSGGAGRPVLDDTPEAPPHRGPAALLSLGATCWLGLRHRRSGRLAAFPMPHGSLVHLDGATSDLWATEVHTEPSDPEGQIVLVMYGGARR